MAKKTNNTSMLRKGIALLATVVTFIFFFLEMIALKTEYVNILKGESEFKTEGIKVSEFLFSDSITFKVLREGFSMVNTIMWSAFVLVVIAIVLTAMALIMKKGAMFSKIGAGILVLAMLLMFAVNFDGEIDAIKITNITGLYFIALALSVVGFASVAKLKK